MMTHPLNDVTIEKKKITEILPVTAENTQVISQFSTETKAEGITMTGHLFKIKRN